MRKFVYDAKDRTTGKIVKSSVSAESERAAAKVLLAQGFTPLKISEEKESTNIFKRLSGIITTKDKVIFTRQLSTLIEAGIPLAQALRTVQEQTQNKRLQAIIQEVIQSIEGGKSLHDSFAAHPEVFDKLFLALVSVGEASGTLDKALSRIATQQEKDSQTMSRIRGAMTYPVIVLFVIIAVMGFMLFTVVPQVEKLYDDLNKDLPFITMVMVSASKFLVTFWWLFLLLLIGGGYALNEYRRTPGGIRMLDNLKLNVPVFKNMFRNLYMARFARTGETLLASGVAMLDMLKITSEAVNNVVISDVIDSASEKVQGGKALSAALKDREYIPELLPDMIKVGEQSGRIDEMLGKTAKIYEDELDEQIRMISTSIEPVLMVVLAVAAGGMVAAILLPIYSLVGNIQL